MDIHPTSPRQRTSISTCGSPGVIRFAATTVSCWSNEFTSRTNPSRVVGGKALPTPSRCSGGSEHMSTSIRSIRGLPQRAACGPLLLGDASCKGDDHAPRGRLLSECGPESADAGPVAPGRRGRTRPANGPARLATTPTALGGDDAARLGRRRVVQLAVTPRAVPRLGGRSGRRGDRRRLRLVRRKCRPRPRELSIGPRRRGRREPRFRRRDERRRRSDRAAITCCC